VGQSRRGTQITFGKLKTVCSPIARGGVGFKNFSQFNKALLGKWLWRGMNMIIYGGMWLLRSTRSKERGGALRKCKVLMGLVFEGILGKIVELFPIIFPIRLGMAFASISNKIFGVVIMLLSEFGYWIFEIKTEFLFSLRISRQKDVLGDWIFRLKNIIF
jgi:hypothetical protein